MISNMKTKCICNGLMELQLITVRWMGRSLSAKGRSCLYHAELPNGITDVALVNTSNGTLNFNEG